ncbi:MAG TPA: hypothetical protein VJX92_22145 [Methylomirabilota bacterium]|nr:hypothetical protein [Methylomirabilota bacterium]
MAKRTNESVASHVLHGATIPKDLDWLLDAAGKLQAEALAVR